jgi:hypothetical protein
MRLTESGDDAAADRATATEDRGQRSTSLAYALAVAWVVVTTILYAIEALRLIRGHG